MIKIWKITLKLPDLCWMFITWL